jgi:hypothetical protein
MEQLKTMYENKSSANKRYIKYRMLDDERE